MDGHIVTTPLATLTTERPPEAHRTRPPVQLSREQILDATARCLHESGYDKTTIRRIAAELGCAVGSIYRYFKDKRQLLSAVTQKRFEPVAKLVQANAPFELSIIEYHRCAMAGMQEYRLMFWLTCVGQPTGTPPLPQVIQQIIDGWGARLANESKARQAWALLHGSIMLGQSAEQSLSAVRSRFKAASPPAQDKPPVEVPAAKLPVAATAAV